MVRWRKVDLIAMLRSSQCSPLSDEQFGIRKTMSQRNPFKLSLAIDEIVTVQ